MLCVLDCGDLPAWSWQCLALFSTQRVCAGRWRDQRQLCWEQLSSVWPNVVDVCGCLTQYLGAWCWGDAVRVTLSTSWVGCDMRCSLRACHLVTTQPGSGHTHGTWQAASTINYCSPVCLLPNPYHQSSAWLRTHKPHFNPPCCSAYTPLPSQYARQCLTPATAAKATTPSVSVRANLPILQQALWIKPCVCISQHKRFQACLQTDSCWHLLPYQQHTPCICVGVR